MREEKEINKLVTFSKILAVLMFILIIVELFSCSKEAHAGTITGETALSGVSFYINKYVEEYGHSPYTEDIELLAEVMYHENYCNGEECMYLTGSVVINRMKHKDFPDTVKKVLYQKGQYSTTKLFYTKKLPDICYDIALDLLKNGTYAPSNVIFQAMFTQGSGIYKKINTDYFCYE